MTLSGVQKPNIQTLKELSSVYSQAEGNKLYIQTKMKTLSSEMGCVAIQYQHPVLIPSTGH